MALAKDLITKLVEPSGADPKMISWILNSALEGYGVRFPDDDVEVLAVFFEKAYKQKMHDSVKTKLNAYRSILTSDLPFEHWHVFEKVVSSLIDGFVDVEHVQPPSDVELVLGGYVIVRDTKANLSREVKQYVKTVWHRHHGYSVLHPIVAQLVREKVVGRHRQVNELAKRFEQEPFEPKNEDEAQAMRLARLNILLDRFVREGEIPLSFLSP